MPVVGVRKTAIIVVVFSLLLLSSQSGVTFASSAIWSQTYGGTNNDLAFSIVETSDGGYALAGVTDSYGASHDFWLVKTDANGHVEWNQTYGAANMVSANDGVTVVETFDGGFALAGGTRLVKTDAYGYMEWNRTYGEEKIARIHSLVQTSDGGYAFTGAIGDPTNDIFDFIVEYEDWFVKTGAYGNMEWNRTYGEENRDGAKSLVVTSDGGYAIATTTGSFDAGNGDFWLVKTDANGNMEWNQAYGGASTEVAKSLIQINEEGFALVGSTNSFGVGREDFWLVKTDMNGNMEWNRTYGGTEGDVALSLVLTSNGGFAIAGYTYSFGVGKTDFLLVKTDAHGNMDWNQTHGGAGYDYLSSMVETSDGGYALVGYTGSFGAGAYDFWLVKTDDQSIIPELPAWTVLVAGVLFVLVILIIFRWGFKQGRRT